MNRDEACELIKKGICPVCKRKISKHTKAAHQVCTSLYLQRYVAADGKITIDGKEYDVRVTPMKLEFVPDK